MAERFGIIAVAPFELAIGGQEATFAAFLPQFGGPAGMIVDSEWASIEPHARVLVELGYGYSAVALEETVTHEAAREMLCDWGWAASTAEPEWL